jgi:hypothetical protein
MLWFKFGIVRLTQTISITKMKRSSPIPQKICTLLPIYFTCLDHESAAASSHQNTLLSLEIGLLGIQYLSGNAINSFWVLAFVGILLCFFIGPQYEYRVNNVDYWRNEILSLTKGTQLEKKFHEGGYGSYVVGNPIRNLLTIVSHWFTVLFIPLIILAWFFILKFYPPTIFPF